MKREVLFIAFPARAPCEAGPEPFHTDDEAHQRTGREDGRGAAELLVPKNFVMFRAKR